LKFNPQSLKRDPQSLKSRLQFAENIFYFNQYEATCYSIILLINLSLCE
jgi:hypothetical protein